MMFYIFFMALLIFQERHNTMQQTLLNISPAPPALVPRNSAL